jgi:plasmid stability protein
MDYKKATFNLDADLHQQLKVTAAMHRREMVDLVRDALTAYLGWNRMTETEQRELKTYELAELHGRGQCAHLDFSRIAAALAGEQAIAAQLLHYLEKERRLLVDVWDGRTYRPLHNFENTDCLYINGGQLHLQLTVPGRTRYELLQQRRTWESTQPA